jgi:hypothetical protein
MKYKLLLLTIFVFFVFIFAINVAQAECGNSYCEEDLNETVDTCCVDCGCEGNQTCYGVSGAADDQKSCIDRTCGDGFCDETLDHNSIPEEYWDNCCDDCGCFKSDDWESEKMEDYDILYYTPTDDSCYNNRCDGCHIDQQCDDGFNGTFDECLYNDYLEKNICFNVPIINCVNDDGYCPEGCAYDNDNDCTGKCGDGVCEFPETCDSCTIDCGCDRGEECVDGACQDSENYCEVRGEIKDGKFCNGINFVTQFKAGANCDEDYECKGACDDNKCVPKVVSRESMFLYAKIGLVIAALAGLVVYVIYVIQRFWYNKT